MNQYDLIRIAKKYLLEHGDPDNNYALEIPSYTTADLLGWELVKQSRGNVYFLRRVELSGEVIG